MAVTNQPQEPAHFEAVARVIARRCRHIIQACLREEEWLDAEEEFTLVIIDGFEQFINRKNGVSTPLSQHPKE